MRVDQLVLEYATPRAGRFVDAPGKSFGVGVVNPRSAEIETPSVAKVAAGAPEPGGLPVTSPVTPPVYTRPMLPHRTVPASAISDEDWAPFPGGELAGRRPKALCPDCRARLERAAREASGPGGVSRPGPMGKRICFQCYRVDLERERALGVSRADHAVLRAETPPAEGTPSADGGGRWQHLLPFEPVNQPRLERLRAERAAARSAAKIGPERFEARRRQAQMAARHALQQVIAGLRARDGASGDREGGITAAIHAAELQLPESWLPFVVSR